MSERHILVSGATGLIGRAVVKRLLELGDAVTAIVRPGREGEVPHSVRAASIDLGVDPRQALAIVGALDGVIHLAQARGWHGFPKHAGAVATVSVAASAYLAEAAIAGGAHRFVLGSSGGIYGPSPKPITEDAPAKPAAELGFYLAAKATAEQLLRYFGPYLTVHVLRPFFVYGPGQTPPFLIPRLIEAVRTGAPVRVDGGRGPKLNPLHVEDAAAAFVAALDVADPLIVNVAGPDVTNVREIAELVAIRFGVTANFEGTDRPPNDYVGDIGHMSTRLGQPVIRFAAGLNSVLATVEGRNEDA